MFNPTKPMRVASSVPAAPVTKYGLTADVREYEAMVPVNPVPAVGTTGPARNFAMVRKGAKLGRWLIEKNGRPLPHRINGRKARP